MSDQSVMTIEGTFSTREGAERAVEHLVQEHGVDRSDVFVQPVGDENSAGTEVGGADVPQGESDGTHLPPALSGAILVSADVSRDDLAKAEAAMREAGASEIVTR